MRFLITLSLICFCVFSCKQSTQTDSASAASAKITLPANVSKVLDAHGGYDKWKEMKAMIYTIKNDDDDDDGGEKQTIDLEDRREKVEGKDYAMGFDGSQYWVDADTSFKKNPVFYTNLMMYFYAMPFVISDAGISYTDVSPFQFEDNKYPGFKVSYDTGIGVSPEDEYYIYYNPETYQMEWLAYTVTYFSKEKSAKLGWIRYDDWMEMQGLKIPSSMAWYKVEDNKPVSERNRRQFETVTLSKTKMTDDTFAAAAGARIVENK